jgi:hypothetical protein
MKAFEIEKVGEIERRNKEWLATSDSAVYGRPLERDEVTRDYTGDSESSE